MTPAAQVDRAARNPIRSATVRSGMRRSLLLLLLAGFLHLAGASPAGACSCATMSDEEAFGRADAVFVGSLTASSVDSGLLRASDDPAVLRFAVSAVYKGVVYRDQELVSVASSASCGLVAPPTGDVLVFANEDAPFGPKPGANQYAGDLCNGTRPLEGSATPAAFGEAAQPLPSPPDTGAGDGTGWTRVAFGSAALAAAAAAVFALRRRRGPRPT